MTRLKKEDISPSLGTMQEYNRKMHEILGCGVHTLASHALNVHEELLISKIKNCKIGIIPISSGEGIILGFSQLLLEIAEFLGCNAKVYSENQKGFDQAKLENCDILLWADDDRYLAENIKHNFVAENGWATGVGFATALDKLAVINGKEKKALVLGAGPVGSSAALHLTARGYFVVLCDKYLEKAKAQAQFLSNCQAIALNQLEQFAPYNCVLDATPADTRYAEEYLSEKFCVAAPCVPCHWSDSLQSFWHDPLQLGTVIMLCSVATLKGKNYHI